MPRDFGTKRVGPLVESCMTGWSEISRPCSLYHTAISRTVLPVAPLTLLAPTKIVARGHTGVTEITRWLRSRRLAPSC